MGISRIFFLVFTINFLFHKSIRNFASIFGLYLPELSLMIWMKASGPLKHVNGWEIEIIKFYLGLQCHWTRSKNVTFRTNIFWSLSEIESFSIFFVFCFDLYRWRIMLEVQLLQWLGPTIKLLGALKSNFDGPRFIDEPNL